FQYRCLARIAERLGEPAQLQARIVVIERQDRVENSINKYKPWTRKEINVRLQRSGDCLCPGALSRLEGEPANRSYTCIFPLLESRRRETKLNEPLSGALPKAVQPVQTSARQSVEDLGKLSLVSIPFRHHGAHDFTTAVCSSQAYPRCSSSSAS